MSAKWLYVVELTTRPGLVKVMVANEQGPARSLYGDHCFWYFPDGLDKDSRFDCVITFQMRIENKEELNVIYSLVRSALSEFDVESDWLRTSSANVIAEFNRIVADRALIQSSIDRARDRKEQGAKDLKAKEDETAIKLRKIEEWYESENNRITDKYNAISSEINSEITKLESKKSALVGLFFGEDKYITSIKNEYWTITSMRSAEYSINYFQRALNLNEQGFMTGYSVFEYLGSKTSHSHLRNLLCLKGLVGEHKEIRGIQFQHYDSSFLNRIVEFCRKAYRLEDFNF